MFRDVYAEFEDPANPTPLVPVEGSAETWVLELFRGPSARAEDLVMEPLGRIMAHQMARRKGRFSAVMPWLPQHGRCPASSSSSSSSSCSPFLLSCLSLSLFLSALCSLSLSL